MIRFVAAAAALGLIAPEAWATPTLVLGDKIILTDSYGNTGGGEFGAQIVGTSMPPPFDFITFCIEYNEHFVPGQQLLVQNISSAAVNGGSGGGNPDPVDARTAYLFTKFTLGTLNPTDPNRLSNYDFNSTNGPRIADANALQRTIWLIEQEISSFNGTSAENAQSQLWLDEATNAVNSGAWTGLGSVQALNLMRESSPGSGNFNTVAQDQLYMYPIPEPGSLLLLGSGLLAVGRRARRNRR